MAVKKSYMQMIRLANQRWRPFRRRGQTMIRHDLAGEKKVPEDVYYMLRAYYRGRKEVVESLEKQLPQVFRLAK